MVNREEAIKIAHQFFLDHKVTGEETIYELNSAWIIFESPLENTRHFAMGLWIEKASGKISRYVFPDQNTKRVLDATT